MRASGTTEAALANNAVVVGTNSASTVVLTTWPVGTLGTGQQFTGVMNTRAALAVTARTDGGSIVCGTQDIVPSATQSVAVLWGYAPAAVVVARFADTARAELPFIAGRIGVNLAVLVCA